MAAVVLLTAACGGQADDEGGQSEGGGDTGPIRIGAAIAETGRFSVEGRGLKNGYDLWAEMVNEAGGIDVGGTKRPVEIIYHDDQSSPEASAQLTERLITEDEVDFLFGPYSSGLTMATSAIAERHKVINMSGGGASEDIFARGFKYVFGLATPTEDYTAATLETLYEAGARTVGLVHIDDAPMTSVAEGTEATAEELGMEIVAFETVPADADFTSAVQRVAEADPDVFLGAGVFQAALSFTRVAEQLNYRPDYMVLINGPADPQFVEELGASAEGIIGPTQWHRSAPFEGPYFGTAEEYAALYEDTYDHEPPYVATMGTGSGVALQMAIEEAGTLETEAVRQALLDLEAETVLGPVDLAENGLNENKPMPGIQIQDGKTVVVAPLPDDADWELQKYSEVGQ
jgi:branched-chain amino acid transport system substrate-binding protein